VEETALAGCTQFVSKTPVIGAALVVGDGKLRIEEPAESMTLYEVR